MINFRWHRGSLKDSLTTIREFKNLTDLIAYLQTEGDKLNQYQFGSIEYYGYDSRCKQNLFIVKSKTDLPLGFIFDKINNDK